MDLTCRVRKIHNKKQNTSKIKTIWRVFLYCCTNLVISPPPPSRSAMSRPSSACDRTPPLVVMVTSLLPTSQVILRPPANRNSAIGDLGGRWKVKIMPSSILFTTHLLHELQTPDTHKKTSPCKPLGQRWEVGKHISCHHVQTGLSELQVDGLQPLVCLSHRIFISGAQTAGGGWCVHPTGSNREEAQQEGKRSQTRARSLQIYWNMKSVHTVTCKFWYENVQREMQNVVRN